MKKQVFTLFAAGLFAGGALAQVSVSQPWVRATVPQQTSSGAFMQLQSAAPARLVGVASASAARAELHKMQMRENIMRMSAVDAIELPAGKRVDLSSGGYHIMLLGLKQQLKEGDTVPLTLTVVGADGKRQEVNVNAPVRPLGYSAHAH